MAVVVVVMAVVVVVSAVVVDGLVAVAVVVEVFVVVVFVIVVAWIWGGPGTTCFGSAGKVNNLAMSFTRATRSSFVPGLFNVRV